MSPLPGSTRLDSETANRLLVTAVANVRRDYPVHWTKLIHSPADLVPHRTLHPVFAGSYDWHSCVHQTWLAARLLRLDPGLPAADEARSVLTELITPENCSTEAAFFSTDAGKYWERPYGWAWLLTLDAELADSPWSVAPLAQVLRDRWLTWIRDARLPIRVGTHTNTAFATSLVLDAAQRRGDTELTEACTSAALRWHLDDVGYGGFEPDAADFLSPALAEADLMRRVLDSSEFGLWLSAFLPDLADDRWTTLREPVIVDDPSDPLGSHLAGLVLSRAWAWRSIAAALPPSHQFIPLAQQAADAHSRLGWDYVFGYGYAAEHWLGTFAAYLELGSLDR
ncbi:hypothetical protein JOF56_011485 [Kibdelosporangium banguiense]|uniref:DUF2891 domain-containing protein n=1 Tax=Kibdelosporangium banguiense TaxID=1365924 RepID=A0ABS4U4G7_9PSEU|nr:DUF2891 domain-containing protein [Kibdelosporangium banguiense]MBP2331100.1 hypothetical protein [Kibdelosporangium banguiense]